MTEFAIETCDMLHRYAFIVGEPKPRCPFCLAIGLEKAREELDNLRRRDGTLGYGSYGGWSVADLDKRIKGIAEIKAKPNHDAKHDADDAFGLKCNCGEVCWAAHDPAITTPCSGKINVSEDFPGSYTHFCDGHGHYEDLKPKDRG